jgi:surfeit locus 1 family protein
MSRRTMLFCAFALAGAAVFIRLGFWQMGRLRERQAFNRQLTEQLSSAPRPFASLPRDTSGAHYRPVSLSGRYDYAHELVVTGRTRQGSPGVELITPVRIPSSDTAVLVNRGWVYSPNASAVNLARWHEGDSAVVTGYVELYAADAGTTNSATDPRIVRRVSRSEIAPKIPYPVASYYLVATGGAYTSGHPGRRAMPALDEGPHRGYAVQWFAFALIALGGATAVALRERVDSRSLS